MLNGVGDFSAVFLPCGIDCVLFILRQTVVPFLVGKAAVNDFILSVRIFCSSVPYRTYVGNGCTSAPRVHSPILDEVQNGLGYQPAWCKAHNTVSNAVLAGNTNGYGYLDLAAVARNALIYYRDVYLRPEYYAERKTAAKALLSDLICEVENGTKDYDTALKEAYTKIYQSINPAYVPNEEIGIDRIYLDIPAADTVMFTQARKLLKEAQTRSVQK